MLTLITNLQVGDIQHKATTQRRNFAFNSFLELNGSYYGFSDEGAYSIGGDDDGGTDIDAYFVIGTTNMGSATMKRAGYMYITMEADGEVYLSITPNKETAKAQTRIITPRTSELYTHREKYDRGAKATKWGFTFGNVDGSNFSVSMIEARFHFLKHRAEAY